MFFIRNYIMFTPTVDAAGEKLDFQDFSAEFEDQVLSRAELRWDDAPFRECFGINRPRARKVVATRFRGRRYLNTLPSDLVLLIKGKLELR